MWPGGLQWIEFGFGCYYSALAQESLLLKERPCFFGWFVNEKITHFNAANVNPMTKCVVFVAWIFGPHVFGCGSNSPYQRDRTFSLLSIEMIRFRAFRGSIWVNHDPYPFVFSIWMGVWILQILVTLYTLIFDRENLGSQNSSTF